MAQVDELYIKITADPSQLDSGLGKAQDKLDDFGNNVKKVGGMLAAAFSVYAIYDYSKAALAAYDEVVKAEAKVAQAIKQTGGAVKLSFTELKDEAGRLKDITLFDDDRILNESTAQLLTFTNIAGENFKRAQIAAMDLSTVLDGDLKSASIQVGKALNDPVQGLKALSRSGVQFSAEQTAVIKNMAETNRLAEAQAMILDELSRQYGGQAEAAAKADVQFTKLGITIGDLKEDYGKLIAAWSKELPKGAQVVVSLLSATLKNMTPDDYTEEARRTVDANTSIWRSLTPGGDIPTRLEEVRVKYQKLSELIRNSKFGPDSGANLNAQFAGQGYLDEAYAAAKKRITEPAPEKKGTTYADLKAQLAELQKDKEQATEKTIAGINKEIAAKEKEIKKWEESGKAVDAAAGSIMAMTAELKVLQEQRDNAVGAANAAALNELISSKEREIQELKKASNEWIEYGKTVGKAMTNMVAVYKPIETTQKASLKSNAAYLANQTKMAEEELNAAQKRNEMYQDVISSGLANIMASGMQAAIMGDNIGATMLGSFGALLTQLGGMILKEGMGLLMAKLALETLNPALAIGAGLGLIAVGSMFSKSAKSLGGGMGSGSGSTGAGYGGGGSTVYDTRGARAAGSNEIVLRVQGRDLVAVTNANSLYYNRKG